MSDYSVPPWPGHQRDYSPAHLRDLRQQAHIYQLFGGVRSPVSCHRPGPINTFRRHLSTWTGLALRDAGCGRYREHRKHVGCKRAGMGTRSMVCVGHFRAVGRTCRWSLCEHANILCMVSPAMPHRTPELNPLQPLGIQRCRLCSRRCHRNSMGNARVSSLLGASQEGPHDGAQIRAQGSDGRRGCRFANMDRI